MNVEAEVFTALEESMLTLSSMIPFPCPLKHNLDQTHLKLLICRDVPPLIRSTHECREAQIFLPEMDSEGLKRNLYADTFSQRVGLERIEFLHREQEH